MSIFDPQEGPSTTTIEDFGKGSDSCVGCILWFIGILVFGKISGYILDDLEDGGVPSKHRPFFIIIPIVVVVVLWKWKKIKRWLGIR